MMNANDMKESELFAQAVIWYCNAQFELVEQVVKHFEALGFDRDEVKRDIRKGYAN